METGGLNPKGRSPKEGTGKESTMAEWLHR